MTKFVPVITTWLPRLPIGGEKLVIVGFATVVVTVKLVELEPGPFAFVTVIGPVVAPLGTVVLMLVSPFTVKVAGVPLNDTAVAPVKPEPVIETGVPAG